MSTGRDLLGQLVGPVADDLRPDDDLLLSGIDSGDLVRLGMLIEDRYGVELQADDLAGLRTLDAIDALLTRVGS
jgi:acyl carrier protein